MLRSSGLSSGFRCLQGLTRPSSGLLRACGAHSVPEPPNVDAGFKARDPFFIPQVMHRKDAVFLEELRNSNAILPLRGQVIIGRVVAVDKKSVLVDTGFKLHQRFMKKELHSHCLAARAAFRDSAQDDGPSDFLVGDLLHLVVRSPATPYGDMQLEVQQHRTEAKHQAILAELRSALQSNRPVMGRVLNAVNGGYAVGIGGFVGFLPSSRASIVTAKKMGVLQPFFILTLEDEGERISLIVSDPYPKPRTRRIVRARLDVTDVSASPSTSQFLPS